MDLDSSAQAENLEAELAATRKTLAELSERVTVLERLAVDDEARLARDIETLRSQDE